MRSARTGWTRRSRPSPTSAQPGELMDRALARTGMSVELNHRINGPVRRAGRGVLELARRIDRDVGAAGARAVDPVPDAALRPARPRRLAGAARPLRHRRPRPGRARPARPERASSARTSAGCRWAARPACGSPPTRRSGSTAWCCCARARASARRRCGVERAAHRARAGHGGGGGRRHRALVHEGFREREPARGGALPGNDRRPARRGLRGVLRRARAARPARGAGRDRRARRS